jgi:hypothetical protein
VKDMPFKAEELSSKWNLDAFKKDLSATFHDNEGWKFSQII